jgi:hypothetical protein
MVQQFVTAYNGALTYYDLSLALHEMNLLRAHVSDFYCPDYLSRVSALPGTIGRRRRVGLPSRRVHIDLYSAMRQRLFSVGGGPDPFLEIDRSLSLTAAKLAKKTDSHLFLHSFYAYWAFCALPDRKRFLYQYHPDLASVRQLLEDDYELHPEVRWSFENEMDSQPIARQRTESLQEWQMADGRICANFNRAAARTSSKLFHTAYFLMLAKIRNPPKSRELAGLFLSVRVFSEKGSTIS